IGDFPSGAGVAIDGPSATGNVVTANIIGTDPTGLQALPNDFGVQILGGASNNLVGGTTAAGNLIAFNNGPGIDVKGDGSVGNQITANRIFSNDDQVALQFDGSSDVSLPDNLIRGFEQEETIEAWFRTTSGGVILGYQGSPTDSQGQPAGWVPALYVGTDGKLYGDIWQLNQVVSNVAVNDGRWHSVALVVDGSSSDQELYLDGQLVSTGSGGNISDFGGSFNQIGTGYTDGWPATPGGWYGFMGQIDDVRIWSGARTAGQVQQDMTTALVGTEPGLEADYPFDEGRGSTAYDQTPNHNDGTLAGTNGDLPTWVIGSGVAIDLGDDGITYNSSAPRQGSNNFQNFPIVVTTADGELLGWLGGSTPDTPFRIDVFASAGYGPGGAGEAQDDLGSLEVTTDSQGQVVFDVPFTPPAGLPVVTATATDSEGNTSEVSALRRATLEGPSQSVHLVPGQPSLFSAASGDGIALQDPDSGPLNPEWDVTLSVPAGILRLSGTAGLAGSGDGSGTLQYQGGLLSLNVALEGMTFTPPPGFEGNTMLRVAAQSAGVVPVQGQVAITTGIFSVTNTNDSGPGSLRQAVLDSNTATGGTNIIDFAISGPGVQTIAPLSPLPAITNPVLIDGFSQPGYSSTPLIEIKGSQAGGGDGLTITGAGVTVRGLEVDSFSQGAGIHLTGTGATGDWIYGNFLGTDPTGTQAAPNNEGVEINAGAVNNLIGTNGDGVNDATEQNLLSGDLFAGVWINGQGTIGNAVAGNFLGT
ncbi:MAG TPA: LamG domain-containing protein, partial [Isosphaeraceae bacterium]|nr:LamG domain-containing protein [Isosphaeraceae bacterium]